MNKNFNIILFSFILFINDNHFDFCEKKWQCYLFIKKEKDYNLYTDNNKITIEVNNQKQITIFTIEGKIIYNSTIQSSIDIELSRGIYIIVIEENREKIIIP